MTKHWVLVVEDAPDIAEIFRVAFEKAQYAVEVVWSGTAAFDWLDEFVPDVVVLDLHLPQVSGLEVLRYIRANERFAHVYLIVTSADPYLANKTLEEADKVLVKPVTYTEVRNLALELHQGTDPDS
ncbi:MAG TPA: response regulator [Aggregatilineaceae bacterium]|nr:response regulator [Aggregatilineaceae bacterium]